MQAGSAIGIRLNLNRNWFEGGAYLKKLGGASTGVGMKPSTKRGIFSPALERKPSWSLVS